MLFLISFYSNLILFISVEFAYLFNLSPIHYFNLLNTSNDLIFGVLLIISSIVFDYLLALIFNKTFAKLTKLRYYLVISLVIYLVLLFIIHVILENKYQMNLGAYLSLFFGIILKTYIYFYSIFYMNLVQLKGMKVRSD